MKNSIIIIFASLKFLVPFEYSFPILDSSLSNQMFDLQFFNVVTNFFDEVFAMEQFFLMTQDPQELTNFRFFLYQHLQAQ
jgi:hypothetical protein